MADGLSSAAALLKNLVVACCGARHHREAQGRLRDGEQAGFGGLSSLHPERLTLALLEEVIAGLHQRGDPLRYGYALVDHVANVPCLDQAPWATSG